MKTKFGKTIAGVALLFCAYGAGGCHGDLDIMQDNKLSASNMWKEESDATSATYGLYVYLRSALKSMNDVYLCWGELRNGLWGPGTHNTLNGVDQSQVRTSTMSSVNEYADWTALYTTVNQANLVIRHVPAMGLKEKPRAFCLGNAHFIRAYCFFQIARIWGDAPLPLWGYESTDTELFLGRTPVSEVLMRVERDIADAERYVADTSDKTVATPAAVAMLKADYALWMYRMQAGGEAYLAMAQEALGELGLSDALLEPAYADIFSSSNKCGREVIFAVHQDVSEALNGPAYYLGWNESYVEAAYRGQPVVVVYRHLPGPAAGRPRRYACSADLPHGRLRHGRPQDRLDGETDGARGQRHTHFRLGFHPLPLRRSLPDGGRSPLLREGLRGCARSPGTAGRKGLRAEGLLHRHVARSRPAGDCRRIPQGDGRRRPHLVDAPAHGQDMGVQRRHRGAARQEPQHTAVAHHAGGHEQEL